jgi:hypothetical protein
MSCGTIMSGAQNRRIDGRSLQRDHCRNENDPAAWEAYIRQERERPIWQRWLVESQAAKPPWPLYRRLLFIVGVNLVLWMLIGLGLFWLLA